MVKVRKLRISRTGESWSRLNIEPRQRSLPLPFRTISDVNTKKSAMFLSSHFFSQTLGASPSGIII